MADRIGVIDMGKSGLQQEMTRRRLTACDSASQSKRFQLFRLRAGSFVVSISGMRFLRRPGLTYSEVPTFRPGE